MIRTWKSLLGTIAVCALLAGESGAQEIGIDQEGVARLRTDPLNETQPADWLYGAEESVWLNDFQPPPGVGVDPVTVPNDNSVGYALTSSVEDILYRINRTHRHFYGLNDGFTSAHAFIPLRVGNGGTSMFAIDPRIFVDDSGRGGLNFGVTARRYFASSDRLLATSLWIDYDEGHRGGYGQFGLYGAIIGRYLTTSAFANIPFGEKEETFRKTLTSSFVGDALALTQKAWVESPYAHYQFEVAVPVPYFSRWGFEYGVGAYALASRADGIEDGFGISNRVEAQVTEDLTVNTLVTSDGVFGSNLSVNMELTLPNGMPSRVFRRKSVQSQLTRSDLRSYRVLTGIECRARHSAAIDPKDGQIIRVAHIDPNVAGIGTGVTSPFGSVADFEALDDATQAGYDIIFVRRRIDGTDTNLNTTITLFDEQQLLGDGIDHIIDTTIGPVLLPDITPGDAPLLTNSAAPGMDVVTLADWNTVSGFTIDASAGTGDGMDMDAAIAINGRGLQAGEAADPGVNGFTIDRNTIQNGMFGLVVDSETSGVSTGVITENDFLGNGLGAIELNYSGTVMAGLTIEDNFIVASSAGVGFLPEMLPVIRPNMGFATNVLAANDDGSTATTVPLGFGIDFFGLAATDVWVNNNGNITFTAPLFTFTPFDLLSTATPIIAPFFADVDTRNHGLEVTYGQDVVQGRPAFGVNWLDVDYFASNVAHGAQLNDFQLVLIDRSDIGVGDFDIEFNYEQIVWETGDASGGTGGLGGASARVGYANGTTTAFELPGSAVNGAFLDGGPMALVSNMLNSTLPGRYRFAVRNGVVTTTGTGVGTGVSITASDSAVVGTPAMPATFRRNEIQGYDDGLVIRGPGMAMMNFDISDNFINGVGNNGITLITEDMETMTVTGDRNIVINSGNHGLVMDASDMSVMDVAFRNSVFNDNTGNGIKGSAVDSASLTFSFTSPLDLLATEDRNGNGILDPLEDLNGNGMIDPLRATAANNEMAGINLFAGDTATMDVTIDDALVDGNTDAGILIGASGDNGFMMGSTVDVSITNSDITNTIDGPDPDLFGDGIVLRTSGFGTMTALIMDNNMTVDGNAGNGIVVRSSENSVIDMTAASGFGIINNTITNNGLAGIDINRADAALVDIDIIGNLIDMNGVGIDVLTDGSNVAVPGTSDTNIMILRNEVTNSTTGDGMNFSSNGASSLFVAAINNLISGHAANGVHVTANDGSFFGITPALPGDIGLPSIFDSNQVLDNGDAGFLLQNGPSNAADQLATLVVDITSDFAVGDPAIDTTLISGNVDGIRIEHNGQFSAGPDALTSVRVGNAFNPFPDVLIEENSDDAVDIDIVTAGGFFNFNISNSLLRGARAIGALTDPGIEILHDTSSTVANIVVGADISDSPLRGPVRNPFTGPRAGVTITDFADDGINIVHTDNDLLGGSLSLRIFDSLIGQSAFGFNSGDGLDILVDNATGFNAVIDDTDIIGNGGDGIRLRTVADNDEGVDALDGQVVAVGPANQSDSNVPPNGIGDTIFDGPVGVGDTTSDVFLNSLPFVLDPIGNNNGYADLTSPDDFIADLQIINGSRINSNGGAGLNLEIGTATRQRVSLQNSEFSGNGSFEIDIETFASFEPDNDDNDQGEGMTDFIGLDPTAKLDIYLGSLTLGPGPEPGPTPVPLSFLAPVGGEGPNFGASNRFSLDYVSTNAEGFQVASTFKGGPRPANLFVRALVPDDDFPVDDMDAVGPPPNMFLDFGMPFDEIDWFLNSLPPTNFPFDLTPNTKWLDLNTP